MVSNERVIWPTALKTHPAFKTGLYGFNNEEPFFTAGHVFFTKAGPKAIKPQIAMSENPDIRVHELSVGDVLLRLSSGPGPLKYEEVTIQQFSTKFATGDHVYGLHFQKGDKGGCTYHANGYLVASNYPDITLKRLKDNFAQLSAKEQRNFATTVSLGLYYCFASFFPSAVVKLLLPFNFPFGCQQSLGGRCIGVQPKIHWTEPSRLLFICYKILSIKLTHATDFRTSIVFQEGLWDWPCWFLRSCIWRFNITSGYAAGVPEKSTERENEHTSPSSCFTRPQLFPHPLEQAEKCQQSYQNDSCRF